MSDDIFDSDPQLPVPIFRPKSKFRFSKGQEIQFDDYSRLHVYEVEGDYVTIHIRKKLATAVLMSFMDRIYDAVYSGPMLEWTDGAHLTFKRKH